MIELVLHPALQAQLTEVELLEIAMHKSVITRLQSLGFAADYQNSDGGTLFYCGQDSFLTQGIGIGAQETTASESEILDGIEAFYHKYQEPVNLEVGLHARVTFLQELARRGYLPVETSDVLFLNLKEYEPNQLAFENLEINQIDRNSAAASKEYEVILQGFGLEVDAANLEFQSTLYNSDNHYSFAIKNEERTIGGGSVFLYQDMAYLAGASVLTEFRGLGAHKQLLHHRLTFAKEKGMKKAYVITPVASASEYNMYKLGCKLLGARVKWSKG